MFCGVQGRNSTASDLVPSGRQCCFTVNLITGVDSPLVLLSGLPCLLLLSVLLLLLLQDIALQTGVILDPVYSGKAVHRLLADMAANPEHWEGKKVLFVHTGGLLVGGNSKSSM